ncbi:hypothetical protein AMTR_s00018p00097460 [Amborella trichopoda]|uniref:Uncharacterized protein n=1 Tax=Amborella trichopoda TaxID=13333 RepID=W1PK84_AMBTC|nr:hypothetical protein AMTR_s00018p00097460 [Amborella trichopoda]
MRKEITNFSLRGYFSLPEVDKVLIAVLGERNLGATRRKVAAHKMRRQVALVPSIKLLTIVLTNPGKSQRRSSRGDMDGPVQEHMSSSRCTNPTPPIRGNNPCMVHAGV